MMIRLAEFDKCVEALKESELDLSTWDTEILNEIVGIILKALDLEVGL